MSGKLVSTEIVGQAGQMFANLAAILEAAGSELGRVLTANIYLTEEANYKAFNETYTKVRRSDEALLGVVKAGPELM